VLDQSTTEIVDTANARRGASRGDSFADGEEQLDRVRSPHVDKKSREQFRDPHAQPAHRIFEPRADSGRAD